MKFVIIWYVLCFVFGFELVFILRILWDIIKFGDLFFVCNLLIWDSRVVGIYGLFSEIGILLLKLFIWLVFLVELNMNLVFIKKFMNLFSL